MCARPIARGPCVALKVARRLGEKPPVVVAFEADAGGREPVSCLIAAGRLDIVRGTVLRYWREDAVLRAVGGCGSGGPAPAFVVSESTAEAVIPGARFFTGRSGPDHGLGWTGEGRPVRDGGP